MEEAGGQTVRRHKVVARRRHRTEMHGAQTDLPRSWWYL